jgi:DNA-binding transcriptional MerR regulator
MNEQAMRLDELARQAGVATTTVRLYQRRGLLSGPRLVGRIGHYDESHLTRLRLIGRLQAEGFSLAGINRLLATWQGGGDLADLVSAERELDNLLSRREPVVLDAEELIRHLPPGGASPELIERAARLGLVEVTEDGHYRVPDRRFLDTGAALSALGIPAPVILDEWEHLTALTDQVAARFIALFDSQLLPRDETGALDAGRARELADILARLRSTAAVVVSAALDASIARLGSRRLRELLTPLPDTGA